LSNQDDNKVLIGIIWDVWDMIYDGMVMMMHCYVGALLHSPTRLLGFARRSAWERWTRKMSSESTFEVWLYACKEYGLLFSGSLMIHQ